MEKRRVTKYQLVSAIKSFLLVKDGNSSFKVNGNKKLDDATTDAAPATKHTSPLIPEYSPSFSSMSPRTYHSPLHQGLVIVANPCVFRMWEKRLE